MKMLVAVIGAIGIALSSCSTTTTELESSKTAAKIEVNLPDGYQEVYRRVNSRARECMSATVSSSTFDVDGQLYGDLGYGEVSASLVTPYGRNHYMTARIERNGSGSKLSVWANNGLGKGRTAESVVRWANGGTAC